MTPLAAPFAALLLLGCAPADQTIEQRMDEHAREADVRGAVSEALNRPGGPDYPAAIRAVETSGRPALQQDYDIGNLMLAACRDRVDFCAGPGTAAAGLARLTKVACAPGEDKAIAAADLARWHERGAGAALPPDPETAARWRAASEAKRDAAICAASGRAPG